MSRLATEEQIVVPKPLKALGVQSPISALPLQQPTPTSVRSDANFFGLNRCFSPLHASSSSNNNSNNNNSKEQIEQKAGLEIQSILLQRSLLEIYGPKAPSSLFEFAPTTPSVTSHHNVEDQKRFFDDYRVYTRSPPTPAKSVNRFTPRIESVTQPIIHITTVDTPSILRPDALSPQGGMPFNQHPSVFYADDEEYEDDFGGDNEDEDVCSESPDEEDIYEEELLEDIYYGGGFTSAFGFNHESDDECSSARSEDYYAQSYEYFRSMTPPMRSENPMCSDDRFQIYSSTPTSVGSFRGNSSGVELGIFNFSPPIH